MKIKINFFGRERGAIGIPYKISQIIEVKKENEEIWEAIIVSYRSVEKFDSLWQMEEFAPIAEKFEVFNVYHVSELKEE